MSLKIGKSSLEKFAHKFYTLAQQLTTSRQMDLETAKPTLLSAVYNNKPLHRHMLLASLSCPTLKAIKEAMLDIKSSYPGETKSNNKTPAGLPQ